MTWSLETEGIPNSLREVLILCDHFSEIFFAPFAETFLVVGEGIAVLKESRLFFIQLYDTFNVPKDSGFKVETHYNFYS